MTTLPHLARSLQDLFGPKANALAKHTGFVQRDSKCNGSRFAQTLSFGFLHNPLSTLEELVTTARRIGLDITPQGLDQRMSEPAARFLQALLQQALSYLVQGAPVLIPLLQRFSQVLVLDSSIISLPDSLKTVWAGCGIGQAAKEGRVEENAALKLHLQLELIQGGLAGLELTSARQHDSQSSLALALRPHFSLRLADLAYFNLAELASPSRFVLTRFKSGTRVFDHKGQRWQLHQWLAVQTTNQIDQWLTFGVEQPVKARLIAARVPERVARARRAKLKKEAKREGKVASEESLALAGWQIYLTNASSEWLSLSEALALGRLRWQIELIFKQWKSQAQIDQWRSEKPWAILCELYAKLLGCVIKHWVIITTGWIYPQRSVVKAGQIVMSAGREIGSALGDYARLVQNLQLVEQDLIKGGKMNQRRGKPNSYQLLLDPELNYEEYRENDSQYLSELLLA